MKRRELQKLSGCHRLHGAGKRASLFSKQRQLAKKRKRMNERTNERKKKNPPARCVWSVRRERGRARCVPASPRTEARTPRHARVHAQTAPRSGRTPRRTRSCVGVRVCGLCARPGSARRLLRALRKVPRPPRALPPACGLRWAGGSGGSEEAGGRGAKTRASVAEGGGRRRRLPGWPVRPRAGLEPSRRRGAAALPSLVRPGRRPLQQSPRAAHRRAAVAVPSEPAPGPPGEQREGWVWTRVAAAAAAAPGPGGARPAEGEDSASREPAPARRSPPLTYLRLRPLWGRLPRVAPSRSPHPEGNSFPLTSSSEMQKISDFDR